MNKIFTGILSIFIIITLTGCGQNKEETTNIENAPDAIEENRIKNETQNNNPEEKIEDIAIDPQVTNNDNNNDNSNEESKTQTGNTNNQGGDQLVEDMVKEVESLFHEYDK